jgi:hypothetical protein
MIRSRICIKVIHIVRQDRLGIDFSHQKWQDLKQKLHPTVRINPHGPAERAACRVGASLFADPLQQLLLCILFVFDQGDLDGAVWNAVKENLLRSSSVMRIQIALYAIPANLEKKHLSIVVEFLSVP